MINITDDSTLIEVRDLFYQYPQEEENEKKPVLKGINLKIKKGEFVGLIGHNGSGKSTLAKLLNGIIFPTQGDILINGMNTKDETCLWEIRQTAGMVFQNPDNQIISSIVEEDVAFGPENLGIDPKEIRSRVDDALETVNMGEYKHHKPHQLSGGQKQRIAIAGILAMSPQCVIFDEATAMLDPMGRKEVMQTIRKLNKEKQMTILYITHYMNELIDADRIIVLNDGKITMEGKPREIFQRVNALKSIQLDVPQMTELAFQLRERGLQISGDILSVDEMASALEQCYNNHSPETKQKTENNIASIDQENEREAILKIDHLSHVYSKGLPYEHTALKDVNAEIRKGAFVGLIGHTGSGKSTLIQHLNGLLAPTSGTVYYKNKDIFSGKKKDLISTRFQIGLVFQYPEHQLFEETVEKDVAFGPKNMGLSADEIQTRVKNALEMVGLDYESIKDQSPFDLSGGQMRRVAIAGVLAMEPDVLILDEPTAGLDPMGRNDILDKIRSLHEAKENTIILVSHSMEDIGRLADKIIVMDQGQLMISDKTEKVFTKIEQLEKSGLSVPEITTLMKKLNDAHPEINPKIFTIEDGRDEIIKWLGNKKGGRDV